MLETADLKSLTKATGQQEFNTGKVTQGNKIWKRDRPLALGSQTKPANKSLGTIRNQLPDGKEVQTKNMNRQTDRQGLGFYSSVQIQAQTTTRCPTHSSVRGKF